MKFSAIVLAAGLSTRMRGRHKMLLPFGDASVVRHSVGQVLDAGAEEVVVVTGFRGRDVMRELLAIEDDRLQCVSNPRHEEGQPTSVVAGCAALRKMCDAVMVCLCDMVLLTAADHRALAEAYETSEHRIAVPMHRGQRGNPVIFAASFVPEILAGRRNMGCRRLIDEYAAEVLRFEVDHERYTTDIDTPEDYERLRPKVEAA